MKKKMTLKYVMVAICGPLFWPALSAYSLAQSKTSAPSGWDNDGRLVVENKKITAVFDREDGTLLVYMKSQSKYVFCEFPWASENHNCRILHEICR